MSSINDVHKEPWLRIGEKLFFSRLLIGFEQYDSAQFIDDVLKASKAEIIMVGINMFQQEPENRFSVDLISLNKIIEISKYTLIGTTSSACSSQEATKQGLLLRDSLDSKIIKLDVRSHSDGYKYPNNVETIKAAERLIDNGCDVLPMISPDINSARKLQDLGCAALRILVGKIGSMSGIEDIAPLKNITEIVGIPVIAEGGISKPSDIALAFEAGADAVLVNTAIAKSIHPIKMAEVMRLSVESSDLYSSINSK